MYDCIGSFGNQSRALACTIFAVASRPSLHSSLARGKLGEEQEFERLAAMLLIVEVFWHASNPIAFKNLALPCLDPGVCQLLGLRHVMLGRRDIEPRCGHKRDD
ncbi:hypothetical protein ONZ45_g11656 [Pleurotus djamor]|nr:hypothetical protein ONZ45_g11656 [Pleurotus djamor]